MSKLATLLASVLVSSALIAQNNVHAFLFCKTSDSLIGTSVRVNFFNVSDKIQTIAKALNYTYKDHYLINSDYNVQKVDSELRNTPIDDNDIVFLYFSTHGGIAKTDTSIFPRLDIPDSIVSSFKEHLALLNKHPKFLITIIEACSGYIETTTQEDFIFQQGFTYEPVVPLSTDAVGNIQALFSAPCNIIITAGQPGKDTWATRNGSMFTNCFLQALSYYINLPAIQRFQVQWDNILQQAKQRTADMTSTTTIPYYPVWNTSCHNAADLVPQSLLDTSSLQKPAITFNIETKRVFLRFKRPYEAYLSITYDKNVYTIDSVLYYLDHSFPNPVVKDTTAFNNFLLPLAVYRGLPIKAQVYIHDGPVIDLYKNFNFGDRKISDNAKFNSEILYNRIPPSPQNIVRVKGKSLPNQLTAHLPDPSVAPVPR